MPVRYMGTKRHIAPHVRDQIRSIAPRGAVVDLFSGVGCVSESLADVAPIVANDALIFTSVLARARFKGPGRKLSVAQVLDALRPKYRQAVAELASRHEDNVRAEQRALQTGRQPLEKFMADFEHVANSDRVAQDAARASAAEGIDHYSLATRYFAGGYFGLRQAIQIDALRFAIDQSLDDRHDDWLLAAWLASASAVINAPGHTAQYLRPNSDAAANRIRRYWNRNIWHEFQDKLLAIRPVGTAEWRRRNRVTTQDALELIGRLSPETIGAAYADPPYTKDQYSRYYHVYETLFLYDFPQISGRGRVRTERFSTDFCLKSRVQVAFGKLFKGMATARVPLILSYPTSGLLMTAGHQLPKLAAEHGLVIKSHQRLDAEHSTMGARRGTTYKAAEENIYVLRPA